MLEKMISCPFCGFKPSLCNYQRTFILLWGWGPKYYFVECVNYKCFVNPKTLRFAHAQSAISVWNSRINEL